MNVKEIYAEDDVKDYCERETGAKAASLDSSVSLTTKLTEF